MHGDLFRNADRHSAVTVKVKTESQEFKGLTKKSNFTMAAESDRRVSKPARFRKKRGKWETGNRKKKLWRVWGAFWNVQRPTLADMVGPIGEPRF